MSSSNTNESSMYAVSNKRAKLNLDSALLWHCRLGHINKKRIEKLQHDGLLDSIDIKSFEKCIACMSGKMARKPYLHQVEKYKDLLGLIRTNTLEFVHDGDKSVAELMDIGRRLLGRTILLNFVQVKGTFPDGTKLITVHDPISSENGNLELALHGSFLPIPSLKKFPIIEGETIPFELILRNGHILLNSGREACTRGGIVLVSCVEFGCNLKVELECEVTCELHGKIGNRGCEITCGDVGVSLMYSVLLQMGFTLILATLDGLDVGLLGDVIGEDDCDDDG
ncbi:retrotransposon protein, putative, ty1-copia subclass [Tanacetum coccineum]